MMQFGQDHDYSVFDIALMPDKVINVKDYSDDDRVEVVGKKGNLLLNRCTTKTLNFPNFMIYKRGKGKALPIERCTWSGSFIDTTHHLMMCFKRMQPRS